MSSDDELSRLLSAERAEQPSPVSVERGLHDLHSALAANAGGPPLAHGPLKLGLSLAVKWSVGSGLLVLALLSAGAGLSAKTPPTEQRRALAATSAGPGLRLARELPLPTPSAAPGSSFARPPAVAAPVRASSEAPEAASTFAEELRLIKSAKQALDAGRDQQATTLLYEHARLYPSGVFQSERDALMVLLDCRRSPALGAASARRFVEQNSRSPLVDRILRACGLTAAPASENFPEARD